MAFCTAIDCDPSGCPIERRAACGPRPGAAVGRGTAEAARGGTRARSHCRFVQPLIHFIPDSLTYSVPLFLKRQCNRTLGGARRGLAARQARRAVRRVQSVALCVLPWYRFRQKYRFHQRFRTVAGHRGPLFSCNKTPQKQRRGWRRWYGLVISGLWGEVQIGRHSCAMAEARVAQGRGGGPPEGPRQPAGRGPEPGIVLSQ